MYKILYISPYRDGTGYSNAALANILCFQKAGYNVAVRPVRMSELKPKEKCVIDNLEKGNLKNIDVIIEHNLPSTFEKRVNIRTIGIFHYETTHLSSSLWIESINKLDEIWVECIQQKCACVSSGVVVPVKILPYSVDIKKYENKLNPLNITVLKDKCVYYSISENTRRKNIAALIRAYYSAFTQKENVILVIKTCAAGHTAVSTMKLMSGFISDIQKAVHIYSDNKNYPPILVLTDYLSEKQLAQLHISCNVFVSPSHGEAGCIPAYDAMGFGNPIIVSNWGNFPELCYEQAHMYWEPDKEMFRHPGEIDCGWLISGALTYCFGQLNGGNDLYKGTEKWFDPNMPAFVDILKKSYLEWKDGSLEKRGEAAKERVKAFSYDNVGKVIKNLIGDKD
jgi:glycosyltransferase involved in cell wall biosynthesis